ncbi:MAG: 6-carboxyhexanoate--CoA ligase [Capsulimonadaceae bacterium]
MENVSSDLVSSIRLRSAAGGPHERGGRHLSGAERLVRAAEEEECVLELLRRARSHGSADFVRITIDRIAESQVSRTAPLNVVQSTTQIPETARIRAFAALVDAGIAPPAVRIAFAHLTDGLAPGGGPIRGAAILDRYTGARLDSPVNHGVRASWFDYAPGARAEVEAALARAGLDHFRTQEALAVATKVLWAGVAAELCWSDDPLYKAGYVATPLSGYLRFASFKPVDACGGRVFFVDREQVELQPLIDCLKRGALWIEGLPQVSIDPWKENVK